MEKPGQLYRDIVRMYNGGKWQPDVAWAFDARSAGKEAQIVEWIIKGVQQPSVLKKFEKNLGIKGLSTDDAVLREFLKDLREYLKNFAIIVPT